MKKYIRNIILLIIFLITILFTTKVQALTIIETTKEDEYDTIKNNSIIIGITKFEPNEILTAGKSSLATFNDAKFNKGNESYSAPKIYYYLQGSWMEIDVDNNAKVIEDTKLIENLNKQDIYFVNNKEKILETEIVGQAVEEGYELVFETNDATKDKEIKYEGKKVFIPATLNTVKVLSKKISSGEQLEIEKLVKKEQNSIEFKSVRREMTGTDGNYKYVYLGNGKIQISRYIGSEIDVVISAEYDGHKVYSIGNIDAGTSSAQRYNIFGETNSINNTTIKSITISEGIEKLETAAFSGCSGLKGKLILPNTLKEIGAYAFNKCSNLTGDLIIPESVTVIGKTAFQKCSGFNGKLILPSDIKEIKGYTFSECSNLKGNVVIPEGVTVIGDSAFYGCSRLEGTLTLPSTLTTIAEYAFAYCSKLTGKLMIPENVNQIGSAAFYKCQNLTGDLAIPEGVTTIDSYAFRECNGLNGTLTLPSTLETIGYASFYKCSNIIGSLVIPEGVTVIEDFAFSDCSKLNGTLTLPTGLKEIGETAFNYCSKLTGDLIIPEGVTKIGKVAFQNCSGFNGVLKLPNTLEEIGSFAFNHCSSFTNKTLTIPKSVKMIGENGKDASHVFYDFAIKTIEEYIVEEGNKYFKSVEGVLLNKPGTRIIAYPANKVGNTYEIPEGVTNIDELSFSRAGSEYSSVPETGLKKLILPNSYILTTTLPNDYINSGNNLAVGLYCFTGVNEIEVQADNPNYKTVDGILYSKDGTVLWYVPTAKTGKIKILDGVTTIKDGAFFEYRSHTVTIPASVTEIGSKALSELKTMGKEKVIFEEGSIFEFKSNGTIGKK